MRGDFDEDEDETDDLVETLFGPVSIDEDECDDDGCQICGGEGWILTCCDDMCHGLGYCMHGDGMALCACNTTGEPPSNAPREWRWRPRKPR